MSQQANTITYSINSTFVSWTTKLFLKIRFLAIVYKYLAIKSTSCKPLTTWRITHWLHKLSVVLEQKWENILNVCVVTVCCVWLPICAIQEGSTGWIMKIYSPWGKAMVGFFTNFRNMDHRLCDLNIL